VLFVWDLDKTYLHTDFGSWKGLVRAALEKAEHKRSFPGAPALLREVSALANATVLFVSGSPRQMRPVLERKLQLDGVRFDELVLKPNLSNLLRGRFRAIREQLGYKLSVLLQQRARWPEREQILFGDDAESDAFIYSLYADILANRIDTDTLRGIAKHLRTYDDELARLLDLHANVPRSDCVKRIFIHLETRTPTGRFERYGRRLAPVYNYFQAALVLYEDGVLDARAVMRVGADMFAGGSHDVGALTNSLQDLYRRGIVRLETARALGDAALGAVEELRAAGTPTEVVDAFRRRLRDVVHAPVSPPVLEFAPPIDYLDILREPKVKTVF
jgi:uncharacterized protein DUF2183